MSDIDELVRRYLASWNGRDPARRRALVDELSTAIHHERQTWELAPAGGPPVIIGLVVMVTEQASLRRVYGFLDPRARADPVTRS